MTGSRRLRVLAVSCLIAAAVVLLGGARAWATVHQTESRCSRPAAAATRSRVVGAGSARHASSRAATAQRGAHGSWRAHTLGAAGCGAWREVHDRMRHHHRHAPTDAPEQAPVSRRG